MMKQVSSKHVGPFGDVEIKEDKWKKESFKNELNGKVKNRQASQERIRYRNETIIIQEYESKEKERRERFEREVAEAERNERDLEIEKWEKERTRRYKPRRPPAGYKDPHEVCKQVLPKKVKEEKRQEIKALMNCIAFTPSQADLTAASEEEQTVRKERKKTAEEMENSLSSDTTSDITDVTPRSSSSGCSSMSKQSMCLEKTERVKMEAENVTKSKREEKLKRENEINLKKSNTKNSEEEKKKDNQVVEQVNKNLTEVELEEMKYLQDAFEDLDVDEETSDFASSIISGLSEERRAKCNRKNMTFTNEQLREIERVNLILLKKIMNHRKPRAKPPCQPVVNRKTSAAINRARMEEKIERENKILLKKLQVAKGTTDSWEKMKPTYALEDLIFETEARGAENMANNEEMDVYAQLQQKEKDLILAAELGKALLEKNKDLEKQIKEISEESNRKIEALEQERHTSRLRLERVQEECESKVAELHGDISELKKTLDFRETLYKQMEKDKSQLIEDLSSQNQRLKDELKESGKMEENLTNQLSSLRDQCNLKKSSLQDHVSSLEILRDEVQMLSDKKRDLEHRLHQISEERDSLSAALDESTERIHLLERHIREQDSQLRSTARELDRVRAANVTLGEQLETMHSLDSPRHRSLLNEMECDDGFHSTAYSSLEKEVIASCETLRVICNNLKNRNIVGSEQSSDQSMLSDLNLSSVKIGVLTSLIEELESLISMTEGRNSGLDSELETRMEVDFHRAKEALERADKELAEKNEELKARAELIIDLTAKLTVKEAELKTALEEKKVAKLDLKNANGNPDELLAEAREARDNAIARKGELELQLARVRIEVLQANSQLMEAVQQKVELSQQLEQWQVDMQCLLDEQMKAKLTKQEKKRAAMVGNQNANASGPRRILSLFR